MRSALYEGTVRHRRLAGRQADAEEGDGVITYEFCHRLFMTYLDLGELPGALESGLLSSARRPALAWFRRADHLGDPARDLAESVRELVRERTGRRPEGPVGLLTHLRCFGHNFNPVSFYWCFEADGERVQAVVAHVTNTPWGESHSYVLDSAAGHSEHGSTSVSRGSFAKQLHVSPLMGMEQTYDLVVSEPRERVSVHIASAGADGRALFDATLSLARRELSPRELRRALARYPLQTVAILVRIYGHALRLRLRGAAYHPHPARGTAPA